MAEIKTIVEEKPSGFLKFHCEYFCVDKNTLVVGQNESKNTIEHIKRNLLDLGFKNKICIDDNKLDCMVRDNLHIFI